VTSDLTHRAFLEKALTAAGEWARFADPKALAVLIIMGLGLSDLVSKSRALLLPLDTAGDRCGLVSVDGQSCAQVVATASYCTAAVAAVAVVLLVTAAVFPRLALSRRKSNPGSPSLFYFEDVAQHSDAHAYEAAVRKKNVGELERDLAGQVYAVSVVASRKHRYTTRAYLAVLVFLVLWVAARVGLALA